MNTEKSKIICYLDLFKLTWLGISYRMNIEQKIIIVQVLRCNTMYEKIPCVL